MYFVYIIKSQEGKYYIGTTNELERRLEQHNSKSLSKYTKSYSNWRIVYKEQFTTKSEALIREKQIKSYKGGNAFKKLIMPM